MTRVLAKPILAGGDWFDVPPPPAMTNFPPLDTLNIYQTYDEVADRVSQSNEGLTLLVTACCRRRRSQVVESLRQFRLIFRMRATSASNFLHYN